MWEKSVKKFKGLWVLAFLLIWSAGCLAAQDPLEMVKGITDKMVKVLVQEHSRIDKDDNYLIRRIDELVLPSFDVMAMSRSVVGRQYWNQASKKTQSDFVAAFTDYVENTYANALKSYNGEEIKFYPMRGGAAATGRAQVTCDIFMNSGTVRVIYNLYLKGGRWMIYDFNINNVSLVKNYNAQFAGVLRQKGLAGLVEQLRNNQGSWNNR